ncbi:MAG: hypothetical protein GWN73_20405, partial [Actinobacteria bacterium]|nr:hypothetical protein [Actinomycetota bacterium]NIU67660.1 hypothetical protein [Actinomycetota bacterium]
GALARLNADPRVGLAERALREGDARTIGEQIELSEIAAPPFEETARAHRMAELMGESGLIDVRVDDEGNVLAATPPADDASDG